MEIKYPLDENEEQYYAATHKKAVQGIDLDTLETDVNNLKGNINKNNQDIQELFNFSKTVVGDTGWVDFQVLPGIKKNTKGGKSGFKTGIREIRIGHVRMKSIRFNVENVPHNVRIAQMPVGFVTVNHSFYATTDGNSAPVRVSIDKSGGISIYLAGSDKDKPQSEIWIYQQYTWIE
ncbi:MULTISPECIES: hypothetical protein [Staphylococcus]|uniref:hypothetical protein n=1 Tax=Staphylococcus TaxID=1279 RepID=UPI000763F862|nr:MULTISPECIES: hypothetical protein [Staphylococcus]KXA43060.1 hypothetical protein HMPREF3215_01983 [Staphylococcus simulans]OFM20098.1 hypothetical protein HMPREF2713_10835 [Staphylococcus sp. HMSC059E03]OFN21601.1 hypothetical protein HMPREF2603_04445 [Staphylococcus sp. HMSC055C03]OHR05215.1 hypothetical protein HMPREF2721_08270 [Staphylococcus sp. HMSC078A12]OHR53404.1 hypothetical protein HMPREF2798_07940 [Staphylococcus sp. HMSC070A03]